jgi:putative methionine-R-sulfoxide reductase with GAF domain
MSGTQAHNEHGGIMDNKKKLSLDDLKVQSFITTLSEEQQLAVRGGVTNTQACTGATSCGSDTATECTSLIECGGTTDGGFDCDSSNCATGYRCY